MNYKQYQNATNEIKNMEYETLKAKYYAYADFIKQCNDSEYIMGNIGQYMRLLGNEFSLRYNAEIIKKRALGEYIN